MIAGSARRQGGHRGQGVDLSRRQHAGKFQGIKAAWRQIGLATHRTDCAIPRHSEAEGCRDADIFADLGGHLHLFDDPLGGVAEVAIAQKDTLGQALGARGVTDLSRQIIQDYRVMRREPARFLARVDAAVDGEARQVVHLRSTGHQHQWPTRGIKGEDLFDEGDGVSADNRSRLNLFSIHHWACNVFSA